MLFSNVFALIFCDVSTCASPCRTCMYCIITIPTNKFNTVFCHANPSFLILPILSQVFAFHREPVYAHCTFFQEILQPLHALFRDS